MTNMFLYFINTYYHNILLLLFFCALLFFVLGVTYLFSFQYNLIHLDKFQSFECGFDPLTDTKSTFSVRYFLIAILFTLFDIETVLVLPFISVTMGVDFIIYIIIYIFILIVFLGFWYEIRKSVIDFY